MEPLPLPLRLAAGLVATAIEEVQGLPKKLIELPVTAVSSVLQTSMRMQQKVTELAIKGDQALGGLREVPETPAWARFDEDDLDEPFGSPNGFAQPTFDEEQGWDLPRAGARSVSPILVTREPAPSSSGSTGPASVEAPDTPASPTAGAPGKAAGIVGEAAAPSAGAPGGTRAGARSGTQAGTRAAGTKSAAKASTKAGTKAAGTKAGAKATGKAPARAAAKKAPAKPAGTGATTKAEAGGDDRTDAGGPPGFEDYGSWTLPQLRGRFRSMSLEQVQALLDWETGHRNRPPYVTMLSNRVASITGR